jgi:hypothetical protein
MAELLVRAKSHYLDKLSPEEVAKMTKEQLQSYNARSQIGDVIVVRPDGWEYIVVRTKETLEEAKKYEESLSEQTEIDGKVESKMLKVRKYNISLAEVSKKSLEVKDLEKLTPVELSVGETINMKVK